MNAAYDLGGMLEEDMDLEGAEHDIRRVRTMLRKTLRVEAPGVAYDIDCVSKDQKDQLEAWLSKAIRGG